MNKDLNDLQSQIEKKHKHYVNSINFYNVSLEDKKTILLALFDVVNNLPMLNPEFPLEFKNKQNLNFHFGNEFQFEVKKVKIINSTDVYIKVSSLINNPQLTLVFAFGKVWDTQHKLGFSYGLYSELINLNYYKNGKNILANLFSSELDKDKLQLFFVRYASSAVGTSFFNSSIDPTEYKRTHLVMNTVLKIEDRMRTLKYYTQWSNPNASIRLRVPHLFQLMYKAKYPHINETPDVLGFEQEDNSLASIYEKSVKDKEAILYEITNPNEGTDFKYKSLLNQYELLDLEELKVLIKVQLDKQIRNKPSRFVAKVIETNQEELILSLKDLFQELLKQVSTLNSARQKYFNDCLDDKAREKKNSKSLKNWKDEEWE